ncbi:MAG: RagB/SusD family nutrient uptake outer membrane protein [Parabacteroides sp.]|nr:RagB/SusD family nutrient uptake outer membrane protein [Parabacteroides sp.]
MKTIRNKRSLAVFCLAVLLGITSCGNVFDELSSNPNQSDVKTFYNTPENCDKGILGIYGYISTPRNLGACGFGLMLTRSDEGCSVADYGVPGAYNEEFTPSYYSLVQPFQLMYTAASQANQMIESLGEVDFSNRELHDTYLGEAYFLRAFTHFFLFINYRNIPLIKELPKAPNEYKPQASPEETWDFIISDLLRARDLLPGKNYWDAKNKGRVTRAAACALLGKAYLYRSGIEPKYGTSTKTYYDEAAAAFTEILNGNCGDYRLVDDYAWNFDVAHENNDESIFEIQFVGILNTDFNPGFVSSGLFNDVRCKMCIMNKKRNSNSSAQVMHNWLYDTFVASKTVDGKTDPRMFDSFVFNDNDPEIVRPAGKKVTFLEGKDWKTQMESEEGTFGDQYEKAKGYKMCSRKWLDWTLPPTDDAGAYFFNGRAQGVNWRMIRYANVLLMYAEAVVMGGKPVARITPLEAINTVRDRAGVPPVAEATMETIENERILELTYEGSRFFDLLRWGKVVERFRQLEASDPLFKQFNRAQYMGFQENKNEWVPLPIDEVEGNPYITQNNPGW